MRTSDSPPPLSAVGSRRVVPSVFCLLSSAICLLVSAGCIVLSLQPAYDHEAIAWDAALLGEWQDQEDNVKVTVERGEWRSYRLRYQHPVEDSEFTGHLTIVDGVYFLDLMPLRGLDSGAVLIPGHLVLKLERDGPRWTVSALDYDRARSRLAEAHGDLRAALDERQNVVLTGSTRALRQWLRTRGEKDFTGPATFERVP